MSKEARPCPWQGHHSTDRVKVYHGRTRPLIVCGYHLERYGVSATAKQAEGGQA